jgi:hypothetical protein
MFVIVARRECVLLLLYWYSNRIQYFRTLYWLGKLAAVLIKLSGDRNPALTPGQLSVK